MRYAIPKAALDQHIIVLGKTRSGKSSMMRAAFVEPLLERGKPVCIVDPKGDWWGLKSSKTGKSAGFPVVIFGGEHADVPINEHSGAAVAELVATGNRPCIIDLGGWMPGERTRFFVAFASALFKHTRGQRWLVIDECHNFAPQSGSMKNVDRNKMLHWANRLASEGLGRGINLIAASQRPQKVHKDFVTSMETLVAMRVIHPLDRGAVKDWIDGCGDPALGKKIIGELAGMERGEAYVWSPEIGFGPERMRFKLFKTYDSFAVRKADEKTLKGWASVDLDEVRDKLASTVAEAEANDPAKLKKRIIELEKRLASNPVADDQDDEVMSLRGQIEAIVVEGGALKNQCRALEKALNESNAHLSVLQQQLDDAGKHLTSLSDAIRIPEVPKIADLPALPAKDHKLPPVPIVPLTPEKTRSMGNGEDKLTGPQRRIIDAIAWLNKVGIPQPENSAVALLAGYRNVRSGGYANPRGELAAAGLIEYPSRGIVVLTDVGRALANYPDIVSGEGLREIVLSRLTGPQRRILTPLLDVYPQSIDNESLATAAGYTNVRSGGYANPRGELSTMGVIEYPERGLVKARDILFPELTT